MTCSGNSTQYCGAGQRLTLYSNNGTIASPSSASSTSTATSASSSSTGTPATPVAVPTAPGFAYQGCYTEATNGRALGDAQTAYTGMTVEKCAAYCSGYTYMAVEYMSECYCGNTIGAGAVLATDNGCSMACSGNSSELCGGSYRLNFYKKDNTSVTSTTSGTFSTGTSKTGTTTSATSTSTGPAVVQTAGSFAYQGCYSEGTNGRALGATYVVNNSMTVEICAGFCKGYTYFGVEYSSECYCDNTIAAGAVPVTDGGCSMTCAGAPSEFCGGPNRLNFYKSSASATSSITSSKSSTSTTSTSSSASASATGPITVQSVPGYGYLGCYSEVQGGRALTDLQNPIGSTKVSVEACGVACSQYTYFGVEYSG